MNRALAAGLVRLHDRAWRDRFGTECRAVLLELPPSPSVLADMALSAAASRRPLLLQSATAALVAIVLALSASLGFAHREDVMGIAVTHASPAARPANVRTPQVIPSGVDGQRAS